MRKFTGVASITFAAAVVCLVAARPCLADDPPSIDSISPIYAEEDQFITIMGSGFGAAPTTDGFLDDASISFPDTTGDDFGYLEFTDITDGGWSAGYGNDSVGLEIQSWSDTEIVVGPFNLGYGTGTWYLSPGDQVEFEIWNSATGSDPDMSGTPQNAGATFYTTVAPEPSSILLMLSGLLALVFVALRRRFGVALFAPR